LAERRVVIFMAKRKRKSKSKSNYFFYLVIALFAATLAWRYMHGPAQENSLPMGGSVTVHFIDVGQGDATLIQTGEGSVLIDGGDRQAGAAVVQYLKDANVGRLAYVIATHPHSDHIGGLINVFGAFEAGAVIMPKVAHSTVTFERFLEAIEKNNIPLQEPAAGQTFTLGGAVFAIVAPNEKDYRNLNNYSVSLRMHYGGTSFLFTADAEKESEHEMLENKRGLSAQVLHVGHHGSATSTTQAFLDAVSPEIAVISVGKGNSFGHPHGEVIKRLENAGAAIYRTDLHGTIIMSTDGRSLTIR
jgi:competence protein ComEC